MRVVIATAERPESRVINRVARKKTPIFDVDGFPGGKKGAAGRHGGSARKKNPKNRRAKKTPKPILAVFR